MIDRIFLRPDYHISRIIKGGWHLAGGHGRIDSDDALKDMLRFVEEGITTFDCADIYTGVESLIGNFLWEHRDAFRSGSLPPVQIHTKFVPDYDILDSIDKAYTSNIIERSLKRLKVERLDVVQFAWWDYSKPKYLEVAHHLQELKAEGKIRYLAVTNFDGYHLNEIIGEGLDLISHQVQYSVLDQRVEKDLVEIHQKNNISTLCYGVIAGGFLSNRYFGKKEPQPPFENRSLTKYQLIIKDFGGWDLFQELLEALDFIAERHRTGIAEVASKYILDKKGVGGIIIGSRNTDHLDKLTTISKMELAPEETHRIQKIINKSKGPSGPFYALERDKTGPHGSIMKYNLNKE